MILPDFVRACVDALEQAGFAAYAVGGCVRDCLLGLAPADYDLCTDALPEQTEAVFAEYRLVTAGKKHGTIGVITEGGVVEITTFRTEGAYQDNRHPEWVQFVPDINADLSRRDFTVNAMAYSPYRGFADPFGGREDLKNRILRAVGDAPSRFREDSLRILRGARFAAKYRLTVEENTRQAMFGLADLLDNLARERVFEELCKLLLTANAEDLLNFAPIVTAVIPELKPCVGFDQHNPHHVYDIYGHTAHVVEGVPAALPLRWAALLHDVGKPRCFVLSETGRGRFHGHARESARMADQILHRLKAPAALREQAVALIDLHMTLLVPEKKVVRRWLSRLGPETMEALLCLQEADMGGKGTGVYRESEQFPLLRRLAAEIRTENACLNLKDLAVNGHDLMALGFSGKKIGICLNTLLNSVLDEQLPNEKEALLKYAQEEQL